MHKKIGFVSTRFAGTDGVTLEAAKWAEVFEQNGHRCYWFAGKLENDADRSLLVPEAFFQDEKISWINSQIFGQKRRTPEVTRAIHELRSYIKYKLHEFIHRFEIDLLVAENALAIPMHVPLGLALTEVIAETQIPTIAHHHDFCWERIRFSVNAVSDYIRMAFPPHLPRIAHVVINSDAQQQLAHRTGISSTVIPNVIDFENPPLFDSNGSRVFRESIGLDSDDTILLQPTRIIQRKGVEYAIELVQALKDPRCKLVVTHEAGDEGFEYVEWLKEHACEHQVDLRLIKTRNGEPVEEKNGQPVYSLWDYYPHADFITYPSLYEGFGNAFLEAIYFRKPILVNRYANFVRDIEPLGFDLAVMDGYVSRKTVQAVAEVLRSGRRKEKMVNTNYAVAAKHYSYHVLRNYLNTIMSGFFGDTVEKLTRKARRKQPAVKGESLPVSYLELDVRDCPMPAA